MLDKRTATLLHEINVICSGGKYEIVEEGELLSCFPTKEGMDKDSLKKTVDYLAERGYVDVKYAEGGVYCLCPLPEGRLYSERTKTAKTDGARRRWETVLVTAIGAFVGGLVGSLTAYLITTFL